VLKKDPPITAASGVAWSCKSWVQPLLNKEFKVKTISLIRLRIIELSKGQAPPAGLFKYEGKTLKNSYKNKPETVKANGMFLVY